MKSIERWGSMGATAVLWCLVLIHSILPFTPVNQHDELRIKVASIFLNVAFLAMIFWARRRRRAALTAALALLLVVYIVSALGGASPFEEGWFVKIVFACGLATGVFSETRRLRNREEAA